MPSNIPDRWLEYKPCGLVIEGTRIICFKVPLKPTSGGLPRSSKWTVHTLLEQIPSLGAVIDLTNTSRYYDPRDLRAAGVKHTKILMPGRIIPPEAKVRTFMRTLDNYLRMNADYLVGVHCTHGLNRTGYMVCRYLRDRLGIHPKEAIKRFEAARGYRIERQNFISDLLRKPPCEPVFGDKTVVVPVEEKRRRRK